MSITVCILTAGLGTRLNPYSLYINKALLPVNKKAIISNIIDKFPKDSEFVIALGYFGEQVKEYLSLVHSEKNIKYVNVDNYDKEGSGTGYSLMCCKKLLNKPFFFVSCDTLWDGEIDIFSESNWVGVSSVIDTENYCNFEIKHNKVISIHDKKQVIGEQYKAFTGLCYIKDYDVFWNGLKYPDSIASGIQSLINNNLEAKNIVWNDVGSLYNYKNVVLKYEEYDFSKNNEFIYIDNGFVVKFFEDRNITSKRVEKAKLNPNVFPNNINYINGQFYTYPYISGDIFYNVCNVEVFKNLLTWLKNNLWIKYNINQNKMQEVCKKFYHEKTIERIRMYHEKYRNSDVSTIINGVSVPSTFELIKKVKFEEFYNGIPVFFHGDLQFDNIIYTENKEFVLLDWRQDFGGHVEFGDLYYDLAKLYGGIILNYDYIKKKLIYYSEDTNINFDFAQRQSKDLYLKTLSNFIKENNLDEGRVRMMVPIIYLNMSPLHNYPFDKMLYSLGRLMLYEEIERLKYDK